jgi:hypothetical protein
MTTRHTCDALTAVAIGNNACRTLRRAGPLFAQPLVCVGIESPPCRKAPVVVGPVRPDPKARIRICDGEALMRLDDDGKAHQLVVQDKPVPRMNAKTQASRSVARGQSCACAAVWNSV